MRRLDEVTDRGPGFTAAEPDRRAEHACRSGSGPDHSQQHANRRRFAGAVQPDKGIDLALAHAQRELVHGDDRSVPFGQVDRFQSLDSFGISCVIRFTIEQGRWDRDLAQAIRGHQLDQELERAGNTIRSQVVFVQADKKERVQQSVDPGDGGLAPGCRIDGSASPTLA